MAFSDGLAATGSSYLLTGLIGVTGTTAVAVWPTFGVILIVVGIISAIYVATHFKKQAAAK